MAKRLEAELGDEQSDFIEGDVSDWDVLPRPEGAFQVGIDGGYVRNWVDKKRNFEDSACPASGRASPPCTTFSSHGLMGRRLRSDFSVRSRARCLRRFWHRWNCRLHL